MIGLYLIVLGFVLIAAGLTVRWAIAAINAHTTATVEAALEAQMIREQAALNGRAYARLGRSANR